MNGVIPDAREREPEPRGHARRRLSLSPLGSGSAALLPAPFGLRETGRAFARNDRGESGWSNINGVTLGLVPGALVDGFVGIVCESPR